MARKVTYRQELVDNNIELSVRHLKQFFKFGHGASSLKTKAVHDISFDIKKGECFGLVGESGCGKTTTGRSLIRLYNITSGSVYFEGYRISAGKRWNQKEIKWNRVRTKNFVIESFRKEKQDLFYSQIPESSKKAILEEIQNYTKLVDDRNNRKTEYLEQLHTNDEIEDVFEKDKANKLAKAEYKEKVKELNKRIAASNKFIKTLRKQAKSKENVSTLNKEEIKIYRNNIVSPTYSIFAINDIIYKQCFLFKDSDEQEYHCLTIEQMEEYRDDIVPLHILAFPTMTFLERMNKIYPIKEIDIYDIDNLLKLVNDNSLFLFDKEKTDFINETFNHYGYLTYDQLVDIICYFHSTRNNKDYNLKEDSINNRETAIELLSHYYPYDKAFALAARPSNLTDELYRNI